MTNDKRNLLELENESQSMRRLAFMGVAVSTVATMVSILAVPLLYNYLQQMQTMMQSEVDFCRLRSNNMWMEVAKTQVLTAVKYGGDHHIVARQAPLPLDAPQGASPAPGGTPLTLPPLGTSIGLVQRQQVCCGCGTSPPGGPGAPGENGRDGIDGAPGAPGKDGPPGLEGTPPPNIDWCFECPEPIRGPPGAPGFSGPPGTPGIPGVPGGDAQRGPPGTPGPIGPIGQDGGPGQRGVPGTPGNMIEVPGTDGQPGAPGQQGLSGPDGFPGQPGAPGRDGAPGEVGNPGNPGTSGVPGGAGAPGPNGVQGSTGACDHCSIPRTAPGY